MSHTLRTFLVVTVLLCGVSAGTAQAGVMMHPVGPGQSYRLAFITAGETVGTSTDINVYDAFVQAQADLTGSITASYGLKWQVIASTPSVHAIDHIGVFSEPIYLVDKLTKVADNSADLWDGGIDAPINLTQFEVLKPNQTVFTGTLFTGLADPNFPLGGMGFLGFVRQGSSLLKNENWIQFLGISSATSARPFYALSEPITVPGPGNGAVPEPASIATWALLGLGAIGFRRRRKLVAEADERASR